MEQDDGLSAREREEADLDMFMPIEPGTIPERVIIANPSVSNSVDGNQYKAESYTETSSGNYEDNQKIFGGYRHDPGFIQRNLATGEMIESDPVKKSIFGNEHDDVSAQYRAIIDKLPYKPEQVVYLGDTYTRNSIDGNYTTKDKDGEYIIEPFALQNFIKHNPVRTLENSAWKLPDSALDESELPRSAKKKLATIDRGLDSLEGIAKGAVIGAVAGIVTDVVVDRFIDTNPGKE